MSEISHKSLREKAKYLLFESAFPQRDEFESKFLYPIQNTGRVGLIGGAIRDLAFISTSHFKSDLDFVVDVDNQSAFTSLLSELSPIKNAFGGYKLQLAGLRIDFWESKKSWVHSEKIMQIKKLEDLLDSTFFNLDAIIFDLGSRSLLMKNGTLQDLNEKRLDINLQDNPNLEGAAVRAIRRMWSFDLFASERLSSFITEKIYDIGWDKMVAIDCKAFPHSPILMYLFAEQKNSDIHFGKIISEHKNKIPRPKQQQFSFMKTLQLNHS